MESLLKQERELQTQIDTYKAQVSWFYLSLGFLQIYLVSLPQLHVVEAQLSEGGEEMKQLYDDLSQLFSLTEGKGLDKIMQ